MEDARVAESFGWPMRNRQIGRRAPAVSRSRWGAQVGARDHASRSCERVPCHREISVNHGPDGAARRAGRASCTAGFLQFARWGDGFRNEAYGSKPSLASAALKSEGSGLVTVMRWPCAGWSNDSACAWRHWRIGSLGHAVERVAGDRVADRGARQSGGVRRSGSRSRAG